MKECELIKIQHCLGLLVVMLLSALKWHVLGWCSSLTCGFKVRWLLLTGIYYIMKDIEMLSCPNGQFICLILTKCKLL